MAKKSNTFKNTTQKKKNKTVKFPYPKKSTEKITKILGLFFLMISLFLFFAFTSFLFTWKFDQSLISDSGAITNSFNAIKPHLARNWAGVVGAFFSHLFICRWFGISSYLFIAIFFLYGFKLLFEIKVLKLRKYVTSILFFIFWFSSVLGFLFHKSVGLLAGGFGVNSQFWLKGVLGSFGAAIFLLFAIIVYFIVVFNIKINFPEDIFQKFKNLGKLKDESLVEDTDEIEIIDKNQEEEITDEPNLKTQEEFHPKSDEKKESDDIDFQIEKVQEQDIGNGGNKKELFEEIGEYDPRLDLSNYKHPTIELLKEYEEDEVKIDEVELQERKELIVQTLRNYAIEIDKIKASVGSTITLYEIVPVAGVRISKIKNLEDDIALSLSALGIRIIAPIPGRGTIGIEVPNTKPEIVSIKSVINSSKFRDADSELPFVLGKTISNEVYIADLAKMPHLLIAGATGQGKSVGLNVVIASLLYKKHPAQLKFVLVDPKKVELSLFQNIENHFLAKLPDNKDSIITDISQVVDTLHSLTAEMDLRYQLLKNAKVKNIVEYNSKFVSRKLNPNNGHKYLPYIILVIDELADLMMTAGKEVEMPIARLAQLARAIGIHLIIATQRPSVNIITGTIKANFPARIAFKVSAAVDSRTILDSKGAEQLVGRGDMLFSSGSDLTRIQCAFIDTPEVEEIVNFISKQQSYSSPHFLPEVKSEGGTSDGLEDILDDLDAHFEDAARVIVQNQQGSTSLLQRRLKLGYNRAGRIIDQLESAGVVGPFEGSKARAVLIPDEYALEQFLNDFRNNR
ncbi:MAG: DNA translocase FtsK 4TM domain-containing protein [Bacteroidota bacterium]|nr:DNA translocase FtsK 4TM domain-containing protein [Bacteroidota bacterium]